MATGSDESTPWDERYPVGGTNGRVHGLFLEQQGDTLPVVGVCLLKFFFFFRKRQEAKKKNVTFTSTSYNDVYFIYNHVKFYGSSTFEVRGDFIPFVSPE